MAGEKVGIDHSPILYYNEYDMRMYKAPGEDSLNVPVVGERAPVSSGDACLGFLASVFFEENTEFRTQSYSASWECQRKRCLHELSAANYPLFRSLIIHPRQGTDKISSNTYRSSR